MFSRRHVPDGHVGHFRVASLRADAQSDLTAGSREDVQNGSRDCEELRPPLWTARRPEWCAPGRERAVAARLHGGCGRLYTWHHSVEREKEPPCFVRELLTRSRVDADLDRPPAEGQKMCRCRPRA